MSGNESPGGDDSLSLSLSLSSSTVSKSISSSSRDMSNDPKYKNYVSAVDKALKSFEYSSEWHDLISALSKLNKVITTWSGRYGADLPRLHLVTKRLSQCLHPNLPGGVHLKTLETYELIFKSIPPDRTSSVIGPDLFSFASGLFPLWTYASEQSRPTLLRIYETYLLPLIRYPALEGFLISILAGLSEDENSSATTPTIVKDDPLSTIGRVNNLLENVTANVGTQNFNRVLWQVLKSNSKIRLAGINYILRKLAITDDESLAVDTLICCLVTSDATNESILIQRATLDLLLNHFELITLCQEKKTKLIKASLQTLLRRDMSLNRRLFSWLLGNDPTYFVNHCKTSLITSCTEILTDDTLSSSEIVRVLISLLDKSEISILDDILLQIVIYFKRIDSKQCANLFFVNLKPEYVFDQVVLAIGSNVDYCNILEYLIELDLSCFEYEKLLPGVFKAMIKMSNSSNIVKVKPVLMLMLKKIELDQDLFEAFIQFYLTFVHYYSSEDGDSNFDFEQFLKPKLMDNFWTDFKLCRPSYEGDIFEKFSLHQIELENLTVVNNLFEELLDPRILKEISNITEWLKALIVIGCHGDVETISLVVKVVKLLEKSLCFEIVEQTYLIELATRFLWDQDQFETLSELICLNKLKVEKILLSFLKDFDSFRKLIEFLDFVGDFGDLRLLVYKLVENLDCSFEQYPLEFLELREQAEEFCCKMLRENDLRFIDVFVSSLLIDFETVGESLSRSRKEKERESLCLGGSNTCLTQKHAGNRDGNHATAELDIDKISIGIGSASDLTSECSYKSADDNDDDEAEDQEEMIKANSTPDLTNLKLEENEKSLQFVSRSMGDLRKISLDSSEINNIPEIIVQDQCPNITEGADQVDLTGMISSSSTVVTTITAPGDHAAKLTSPFILTPSTELGVEAKSKSASRGFSKKLAHPHLKVSKDLSEDVQNRILYVLAKMEKFLTLKPDLFINYLKSCNTNQSPRINFREDCVYLELLLGKLLDFMCVVIPNEESHNKVLQLTNLNIQFKSCNVLKLLLDKVLESERMEIVSSFGFNNGTSVGGASLAIIGNKSINSTPLSSNTTIASKRQHFTKLKRKSSNSISSSHFVADLLTRVKVQKTLLFILRSTTTNLKHEDIDETGKNLTLLGESLSSSDNGADLSLELLKSNYGQKYLTLYQGLLLSLFRTVISLESLINSVHHHYHATSSRSLSSLHRNHPSHKYLAFLPLTNQPLFHEILLTALEFRDDCSLNANHFNWMELNLHILPFIINTNCPVTILTVTQICKNLQPLGQNGNKPPNEVYILRSLDYLIAITNAVLFRHGEKSDKPQEAHQNQSSSSIYGIITSFLPGGSSTSPKIESVDEIDCQSKDLLSKLDVLIKTALAVKSPVTLNRLRNLLNPICNNYLENFLTSLSILKPSNQLTDLCKEIETMRVEKLTIICTRILNRNLLLFYRGFVQHIGIIEFNSGLLSALVKECLTKSVGLMTICEVVNDLYSKFKPESWSKQDLKELQENLFKVFDRLVTEVCNQNSYMLMDSNSVESNSSSNGQVNFLSGQGLQGKSYNFKKVTTSEENMEEILASLCINLPSLIDLLWTDDKDRDKVMPMLTHLLGNLIGLIKLRHTSTASYVSILKLLKNMSYYSYFRKAWKKEVFEMLLLDPTFFQMIKPHYYFVPYGWDDECNNGKLPENQCVIQIWKVMMDNLFTQDKSSFSELLTRVSVPPTTGLNIFTSKDTEFEGRALLLKRLAFVIWSSEPDQFYKFITNIQERLAEALKTPNSPQIVPVILRSVFLCFRVLILKFTNLIALWPIMIHEIVQVLLLLEKQLANGTKFDQDQLACALEVFKLIELLTNLPTGTLPLFQMYRWAFLPYTSISSDDNLLDNNNINNSFIPFLSKISILVDDANYSGTSHTSSSLTLEKERHINPSRIRILTSLCEISGYLNGHCDNIGLEELCCELDLDFIEC